MKRIVDISDEMYDWIENGFPDENDYAKLWEKVKQGIPLVRCKDCEHWEKSENSLQGRCRLLQMYPTGEWFCGNGKSKE